MLSVGQFKLLERSHADQMEREEGHSQDIHYERSYTHDVHHTTRQNMTTMSHSKTDHPVVLYRHYRDESELEDRSKSIVFYDCKRTPRSVSNDTLDIYGQTVLPELVYFSPPEHFTPQFFPTLLGQLYFLSPFLQPAGHLLSSLLLSALVEVLHHDPDKHVEHKEAHDEKE